MYTDFGIRQISAAIVTQALYDLHNPTHAGQARWWLASPYGHAITSALEIDTEIDRILRGELVPDLSFNRNTGRRQ